MLDIVAKLLNVYWLLPIFITAVYYYFTATFDFWEKRGVPFKKPTIFVGNFGPLLLFQKSQPEGIQEMYNWFRGERFFGVFRVRSPILIIRDPELVKCICVKDFGCFMNRAIPVNSSQDPLAGHLFNLEGKRWKSLRSKLTPAFSSNKIKKMFYLLVECSEKCRALIDRTISNDQDAVEVRELAANFTIDVIGSCAFGIQINALTDENSEFRKAARILSKPSYKAALWRMLRSAIPRLYRLLGVQVINPKVTEFFQHIVSQMVRQREESEIKRHDFMDLLVELKNKGRLSDDNVTQETKDEKGTANNNEFTEKDIVAQVFVFFVAGFETSSNTIAFALFELAQNPEIQQATRQDIESAINRHNGELTYETISEMKYLELVILETLRKYPPAPLLSRRCEYTYQIPDSKVELLPGMRVVIPIYGIHHDPDYYPEPEVFKPERFTDENKRTRHQYTFLPFGEGPRSCIGARFALLQTKVGLISFLRHHRVEPCEKTGSTIKFSRRSIVTSSEKGIWLKITALE